MITSHWVRNCVLCASVISSHSSNNPWGRYSFGDVDAKGIESVRDVLSLSVAAVELESHP